MADVTQIVKHLADRSGNCFLHQLDEWFGRHLLIWNFNDLENLNSHDQACLQKEWHELKKNIF